MTEKTICPKHGPVAVWIVCSHIADGTAGTIIFTENQDALCFDCARNFQDLTEENVVGMCKECLKDFTAKLMIDSQTFANLQNRIEGIRHLKGKWTDVIRGGDVEPG